MLSIEIVNMGENNHNSNGASGNGHKKYRQYTDREKAAALAALDANGGNDKKTSDDLGIPRATIQGWAKSRGISSDVPQMRLETKRDLAEMFEELARKSVETALGLQDHEKTTLSMAATAAGIATDKMQLLNNKPTSIQGVNEAGLSAAVRRLNDDLQAKYGPAIPPITPEELRDRIGVQDYGDTVKG